MVEQVELDQRNASFWSELCGTGLAQELGITGDEPGALERFDREYFRFYPYLRGYVDRFALSGRSVLEIGLGYGTLGQYIAQRGAVYHGLDIAPTPVEMMRHRLRLHDLGHEERVRQGSALDIPWPDEAFDAVYSIGCLHHTGDLYRSANEVRRVLKEGGTAVVMLYNRDSARRMRLVARAGLAQLRGRVSRDRAAATIRGSYDQNVKDEAAPHTDFTSRREARRLFGAFSRVGIDAQNFDDVRFRRWVLMPRDRVLRTRLPRVLGLDLYIVARK